MIKLSTSLFKLLKNITTKSIIFIVAGTTTVQALPVHITKYRFGQCTRLPQPSLSYFRCLHSTTKADNMDGFYRVFDKWYYRHKTMTVKLLPAHNKLLEFSLKDGHYKPDIEFPLTFQQDQFTRIRNFLSSSWGVLLISSTFKEKLAQNGITGWKTFPIHLIDKTGMEIPGYEGFSITGRCGPRDRSKSMLMHKNDSKGGILYSYHKGVSLDLNTWDGSDIFIERYYCTKMISPKAAKVFKKQNALELQPLSEVEMKLKDYAWWYDKRVLEGIALPSDYKE